MSRSEKREGYAVSSVFPDANNFNTINSLQGKVAGVNITNSQSCPGLFTRVVVRGNSNITGSSEPLGVVDGIPYDNTLSGPNLNGGTGYGNGANDINPEDVQRVYVQKGSGATALYGSRAANGVIIIQTKEQYNEGLKIKLNSLFEISQANKLPSLQNSYSQGRPINGENTLQTADDNESFSWGPKINNSDTYDQYSFFKNGYLFKNHAVILYRNLNTNVSFSVTNNNIIGIIPSSQIKTNSVMLKINLFRYKRFRLKGSVNYTNKKIIILPTEQIFRV